MIDDTGIQRDALERGNKARGILESPLWAEVWAIYEQRILDEFKACKSDDTSRMQQLKMLHLAGVAAQKHLESILEDGKFAAHDLAFKEQQKPGLMERLKRVI